MGFLAAFFKYDVQNLGFKPGGIFITVGFIILSFIISWSFCFDNHGWFYSKLDSTLNLWNNFSITLSLQSMCCKKRQRNINCLTRVDSIWIKHLSLWILKRDQWTRPNSNKIRLWTDTLTDEVIEPTGKSQ